MQKSHENKNMRDDNHNSTSYLVDLTDSNFKSIVVESEENFVVEVCADWSGECFLMSRNIEETARKFHSQVQFGRINIDLNERTSSEYGITDLPFILFFRKGELVFHSIGLLSAHVLEREIIRIYNLESL